MSNFYDYRAKAYTAKDDSALGVFALATNYRPLMLWALQTQKDSNDWVAGDVDSGLQHISAMQWEIIMQCGLERLEMATNRLYMLLDSSINGATYAPMVDPDNPSEQIAPPLPIVPLTYNQASAQLKLGLRSLVAEARDRDVTLIARDGDRYLQLESIKAKLDQLLAANNSEDMEDILNLLTSILAVL